MKKSIKQFVKSGAVLLALSLAFTSCDELIGELDNIAPNPVTPTPEPAPNMLETPLTLEAAVAGAKVTFKANNPNSIDVAKAIEYSTDGGATWTAGNTGGEGVVVELTNVGDKVMFRGNNSYYSKVNGTYAPLYNSISCTADCYVYGNIMSLINADNFATLKQLTAEYTFYQLFMDNSFIKNHPNAAYTLELPATTLTDHCYDSMFNNCKSLVTPPALPATTLEQSCYSNMFSSCTSLATAPALPATELKTNCYMFMFQECTSLESTPKLPAETLATSCYQAMFRKCGNLKEAWVKADYVTGNFEYKDMFLNCKSGGVLHTASTSTNWNPGTGFPADWTIEKDY